MGLILLLLVGAGYLGLVVLTIIIMIIDAIFNGGRWRKSLPKQTAKRKYPYKVNSGRMPRSIWRKCKRGFFR
jgi:hypothetical protein